MSRKVFIPASALYLLSEFYSAKRASLTGPASLTTPSIRPILKNNPLSRNRGSGLLCLAVGGVGLLARMRLRLAGEIDANINKGNRNKVKME